MNTLDDNYFINLAIIEAKKAEKYGEVPVGAVLVDENQQIIASAYNQPIATHNPTAHAEIEVLKKAGMVKKNYRCPMCAGAIIHARVERVVFCAKDFRTGACGTNFNIHNSEHLNHNFQADFIENSEYISVLKNFFKQRR